MSFSCSLVEFIIEALGCGVQKLCRPFLFFFSFESLSKHSKCCFRTHITITHTLLLVFLRWGERAGGIPKQTVRLHLCTGFWSAAPNESTADILPRTDSHWAIIYFLLSNIASFACSLLPDHPCGDYQVPSKMLLLPLLAVWCDCNTFLVVSAAFDCPCHQLHGCTFLQHA